MPADKRPALLDAMCAGDPALRQRLDTLLAARQKADELSAKGAPAVVATIKLDPPHAGDEAVGKTIGRYKVLEKVGEGGCGVVYVAEQTEPVRRRVALKVIKLGMDTKQVVARFEAERQALAMMDHANIARVLDAGSTETGRPFFVMELVRGIRITDYCDQHNLSTKERLELFIKVCQAIQHAHQKGIIHRDIKPSNILVTLHDGVPVPKVIDFGIAKATEGRLTDGTVYTQLHQFIGTPAYMSPEQAEMSGLDIDTRSDIYSLGVLLYELLTGRTPFDSDELMSLGLDEMRKAIREKDPMRPSTRFATLEGEDLTATAKRRSTEISKLMHQLKGDLDWIVMKALEKDRTRRYETANGLAADLKRHLSNETVVARPPSSAYRFQKLVRRNKLAFAAGVAIAAALLLGTIASTWQSVRATRAKREALAAQASESVQRQKAEANEQKAITARAEETKLRQNAEAEELAARQRAYASDMNVAALALAGNNLGQALDLLNRQRPGPGQRDLRGWEWRYLWQQTRSDALFTLCQEPAEINSLAVSPDGLFLAIGSYHRGGLSVWDVRLRQELIRLATNEIIVRAAFSPTEPLLAFTSSVVSSSGGERYPLRLWNTETRRMVAELPLGDQCVGLGFAKDGQTLVTSTTGIRTTSTNGQITVWRVSDRTQLASYHSTQLGVDVGTSFAASPDLSLAAYASGRAPSLIRVIDLRNGRELWAAPAAKVYVTALAISPDGRTLASAGGFSESDIRLWDAASGKEIGKLEGHGSWVSSLVFSADGKQLTSSSADQTIRTWDIASEKCLDVLRGHRQEVWRLALLPNDKTVISGAKDGAVCFWDTSVTHPHQPHATLTLPKDIMLCAFAADSQSILMVEAQGQVSRWTAPDFQEKAPLLRMDSNILSCRFSSDGRFMACCWTNGVLQVWDASQRVLLHQLTNAAGYVYPVACFSDGRKLVTHSASDRLLHEMDLTTGLEMQSWQAPPEVVGAALTRDGRFFMATGYEGDFVLRNLVEKGDTKVDLDILEAIDASYSPDETLLAAASRLGYARVWDAASWKPVATLGGFLNATTTVSFSPDGKRLAVSSDGNEAVKLYETDGWQNVFTLEGQGTGFQGAGFSPDGNAIVWGNGTTLYLWRAPSWEEITAAEVKDPPSPGYGGQGKAEIKQP